MDYALYILAGEDKGKVDEFVGDTSFWTHAASGAIDAAQSLAGFDFFDVYASKLSNENSVGLTGEMVREMDFKTLISKHTKYQITPAFLTDVVRKDVKHTLTVKGILEMPNLFFKAGTGTAKKKDASRIWKWANAPIGSADDVYYRDVVATVFASDDRQFRALILKRAFVESYEEYFDTNGEGHFTLTVAIVIPQGPQQQAAQNVPSIEVQGPSFEQTFTSIASDVATAAKSAGKAADAGADAAAVFVGEDNEIVEKIKTAAKGTEMGGKDIEEGLVDGSAWEADNISKEIAKHTKYIVDNVIDGKPVEDDDKEDEKDDSEKED